MQRGIVYRLEIPQAAIQPAVEVIRSQLELGPDGGCVIGRQQRGQQHLKLLSEAVVGIEADRLQTRLQGLGGIQQLQIDAGKKAQVLANPAVEIVTRIQPDQIVLGSDPAVILGADQIEVFRLRAFLPLADVLCVLRTQPGFEEVSFALLGVALAVTLGEGQQPLFDFLVGLGPLGGVGDARQQVAFEHVGVRERQPTVIHGFEDRVGIGICVSRDLDQLGLVAQPIHEVRQRLVVRNLRREGFYDVVVAPDQILD